MRQALERNERVTEMMFLFRMNLTPRVGPRSTRPPLLSSATTIMTTTTTKKEICEALGLCRGPGAESDPFGEKIDSVSFANGLMAARAPRANVLVVTSSAAAVRCAAVWVAAANCSAFLLAFNSALSSAALMS